jgi:hypothetical protein
MSQFIHTLDNSEIDVPDVFDILPDDFDDIPDARVERFTPYRLTRRTNIAYQPELLAELRNEIAEHNARVLNPQPIGAYAERPPTPGGDILLGNAEEVAEEVADDAEFADLAPIPMVRQETRYRFIVFANGLYIDQDGNITTPEEHGRTHESILAEMAERGFDMHIGGSEEEEDEYIGEPILPDIQLPIVPADQVPENAEAQPEPAEVLPRPLLVRQTNRPAYWIPADEEYPELSLLPDEEHPELSLLLRD